MESDPPNERGDGISLLVVVHRDMKSGYEYVYEYSGWERRERSKLLAIEFLARAQALRASRREIPRTYTVIVRVDDCRRLSNRRPACTPLPSTARQPKPAGLVVDVGLVVGRFHQPTNSASLSYTPTTSPCNPECHPGVITDDDVGPYALRSTLLFTPDPPFYAAAPPSSWSNTYTPSPLPTLLNCATFSATSYTLSIWSASNEPSIKSHI